MIFFQILFPFLNVFFLFLSVNKRLLWDKMTRGPQTCLLLIIIALASGLAALKLPYEVLDSIVEVSYLN